MAETGLPIRRWRIANFKSIEAADLELAGLTVIVGANSSGKSSILQSILLAAQAAQSKALGPNYPLNGDLVQLGEFADVKSAFAQKADPVRIGGVFDITSSERRAADIRRRRVQARPEAGDGYPTLVDWTLALHGQGQPGWAAMQSSSVSLTQEIDGERRPLFQLESKKRRSRADSSLYDPGRIVTSSFLPRYPGGSDAPAFWQGKVKTGSSRSRQISGVNLTAGFPRSYLTVSQEHRELARQWVERALMHQAPRERTQTISIDELETARSRMLDLAVADLRSWKKRPESADVRFFGYFLRERVVATGDLPAFALRHFLSEIDIEDEIAERLGGPGRDVLVSTPVQPDAWEDPLALLGERVAYLGPLRQGPEVVYRRTAPARPRFLGTRGEFTAPALHLLRNERVIVPMPGAEGVKGPFPTLAEAMNAWMSFLEAAATIETRDKGRLGIELIVTQPHLSRQVDLTSVGVGVSQVVPVVLLCLLSQPGSVLLLEQPELHLHPAMQQRLADFFVSMARSGRQLLVETHSEYLVNRLRLRVAQDGSDATSRLISLINISRDEGRTHCEHVQVNRYGSIVEWPTGFFDQGATEAEDLLTAGLEKRSRAT